MNKFDEFIAATDKDLEVDTSTRVSSGSITLPAISSPGRRVSGGSISRKRDLHTHEGTKTYGQSRQTTPQRLSHQDHPLKYSEEQSFNVAIATRPGNGLSKRRSLIQPIVAPKTPEGHKKFNTSAPTTLMADRSYRPERNRSGSNASFRSSTADTDVMMSTLLQNLANKELEILDAKQRIEELKKQLASEDILYQERLKDLQELKEKVTNHFHKATNNNTSPTVDRVKKDLKGDEQAKKRQGHGSNHPVKDTVASNDVPARENRPSVWSKSLAIFNQFDQIIQNELERSLHWEEQSGTAAQQKGGQESDDEVRSGKQNEETISVTKSLWSFVSDMKYGLLGIEEESDSRQQNETFNDDELIRSELEGPNEPAVNDNKLKFVGGEMSAEEEEASKNVEMKDMPT
ncbi:hypothetical protein HG536_0A01090 [Torulaspora globosa]|uniref:Topoisomerase I damage affected protein 11 n=1 Tax=Torulaspora globosa TaxID=48254 RepID=A0A7G3Z9V6_9SACH|nr:uncharacterized protein HG536_0A01090 [Torulaspora globosa]QLL30292.1 hypothetical protein HG536_0A01090 [Torulaspora globosa]